MKDEEIAKEIERIRWWHTIDLGEYGSTKGMQSSIMEQIKMPNDFTNKTVLDIGTADGFYAFEAEKRNAKKVLAVDSLAWKSEQYCELVASKNLNTGKDGFNLARKILNSKVEDLEITEFDDEITPEVLGEWDVVLCLGVLYHMKDPFRLIRNLGKITKEMLILETHTDCNDKYAWYLVNLPKMAFYPNNELNNDATNWWGPNIPCIIEMLKYAGFKNIDIVHESRAGRTTFHAFK